MSPYEFVSTLVALLAIAISVVSLVRTRKNAEVQTELARISAQIAERQLDRLVADEQLEDQPRFAVRVTSISGIGEPSTNSYEVRVTIRIDNSGYPYLESKSVRLVTLQDGACRSCPNVHIDFKDRRSAFNIEDEHTLVIRRGADLLKCSLHVHYVDRLGKEKIQKYRVIPEGRSDHYLPSTIFFPLSEVSSIVPGTPWNLK
jgi:hypothetical protein